MNVVIVGAGKTGLFLVEKLRANHVVTVIESRPERADYVAKRMPDVKVVRGEDNLVVSFLAKTTHKVPMVFARTNHPKNEWMFTKQWGVDVGVSTASVIYSLIEKEVSLGDVITLMGLSAENMVIDALTLTASATAVGKTIAQLNLPKCAHIMAIISKGEITVPHGDTVLSVGDEVLILSDCGEEKTLRTTFGVHAESR